MMCLTIVINYFPQSSPPIPSLPIYPTHPWRKKDFDPPIPGGGGRMHVSHYLKSSRHIKSGRVRSGRQKWRSKLVVKNAHQLLCYAYTCV